MLEKLLMNLQLFAAEDELEDMEELEGGGYVGEEEEDFEEETEDETGNEDLDDEEDLEEDPEDEDNPTLDKKTKSIIKHKKEKKELKRQLQEAQEKLLEVELEKEQSTRVLELTESGMSSTEATKKAESEIEVKRLRNKIATMELEKLEDKYPGISSYSQDLAEAKAKMPEFSYEQLYLANHSKQTEFDRKTKLEQEILHKNKKSKAKSLEDGPTNKTKSTKLSSSDERIYKFLLKTRPQLTRKQYLDLKKDQEMDI